MDENLVAGMRAYLNAGLAMDLDTLDQLYDPEFTNVRVDRAGRAVTLTKDQFMARFRSLAQAGQSIGDSIDDVTFPATSTFGDHGAIVMHRVEDGVPALATFLWRLADGQPVTILREFSYDEDLTPLLSMLAAAQG